MKLQDKMIQVQKKLEGILKNKYEINDDYFVALSFLSEHNCLGFSVWAELYNIYEDAPTHVVKLYSPIGVCADVAVRDTSFFAALKTYDKILNDDVIKLERLTPNEDLEERTFSKKLPLP